MNEQIHQEQTGLAHRTILKSKKSADEYLGMIARRLSCDSLVKEGR
jgi:hypothetical protein